jgi:sodium-dependent phosphate cotransporter
LADKPPPQAPSSVFRRILRIAIFVAALYAFLLSIEMISGSLKLLGMPFAECLINLTNQPVIGLFIGILVTVLIQSSSATTSLVVCFVAAGTLSVEHAIPIVMGANIGTTITNSLVSLYHVSRRDEFTRAFPAAMVHDIFNLLAVLVLLPIEIFLHPIGYVSGFLAKGFAGVGGFKVLGPLQIAVKPVAKAIICLVGSKVYFSLPIALVLLFFGLKFMVDTMRRLAGSKTEVVIDRYLFGGALRAFFLGLVVTAVIQSSSVTTSFIVPLVGAGLVVLEQIFPYTLGANVGTTVTAILAALVTGSPFAIQVAFAHLIFNIFGISIWYPLKIVPLSLARLIGKSVAKHRWLAFVYILVIFIIIPLGLILLLRR